MYLFTFNNAVPTTQMRPIATHAVRFVICVSVCMLGITSPAQKAEEIEMPTHSCCHVGPSIG